MADPTAFGLAGRSVLVTGASRGIGLGVATRFVEAGARVTLLAETDEVHAAAETLAARFPGAVSALLADVADEAAVQGALAGSGRIDVLVNNAGMERETRLDDPDAPAVFARTMAVNVTGMFHVTAAALPAMGEGAAIVNTASVWGRLAPAGYAAYAASKHAVIGFTRAAARELGPRKIRVNAVCPGWVETGPALATLATMAGRRGMAEADLLAEIEGAQDIPGLMTPADVADLYLFLASPFARNLTGQAVNVDRGAVQS